MPHSDLLDTDFDMALMPHLVCEEGSSSCSLWDSLYALLFPGCARTQKRAAEKIR